MNPKEIDLPLPSSNFLAAEAARIIEESTLQSLGDLATQANIELPHFKRLIIMGYIPEEDHRRGYGNTWYGLTNNLQLQRYQHRPSWQRLSVCETTSEDRLQEIVMALALKKEKAAAWDLYGQNLRSQQIEILAQGFCITIEEAEIVIGGLSKKEIMTEYDLRVAQLQW